MMEWTRQAVSTFGGDIGLIYSLAVPMKVLRKRVERSALIAAMADAPCDAIWLKIENFGDDATGEKTAAYIEASGDFHERGIPVVGDHVGGLPGLGALAFGGIGGIAHGVTMQQGFKPAKWRRSPERTHGGPVRRVYLPQLDMLVKPSIARHTHNIAAYSPLRFETPTVARMAYMTWSTAQHGMHYQRAREVGAIPRRQSSGLDDVCDWCG